MRNRVIDIDIHNNAILDTGDVAILVSSSENPRELEKSNKKRDTLEWVEQEYLVGEWVTFPFGSNNDLPREIRDIVQANSVAPGILKKKTQLLWGKGPRLYRERINEEKGTLEREWLEDKEVQDWLESWDAEGYLTKMCVDYNYLENTATKFVLDRGHRIGRKPLFAELEWVNPNQARKARKAGSGSLKATHCLYTLNATERMHLNIEHKVYPLFEYKDPFKYRTPVLFSNMYSFCSEYYAVPDLYGSLEWIRLSTATPLIFKALQKNSMNLKYHIKSPESFWKKKKEELEDWCKENKKTYKDSMLVKFRDEYLNKIAEVLSGLDNTGKFWHSVKYAEIDGIKIFEHGWDIEPLDQKIIDFVQAHIQIGEAANRSSAAGVGMHPALGGAGESGRADSGSEQLYALKNYLITGIDIPEMITCKALNYAIRANWPKKDIRLGFYHMAPEREEDISSSKRTKEKIG